MEGVGDRVRQVREEMGKSQGWLAKKVHVSQPAISKLEKGGKADTRHVLLLAEALGVSPIWLKHGTGPRDRDEWMDRIVRLTPGALAQLDSYLGYLEKNEQ
jgi:transcriptional regulator with XRE-family HTH domain